MSIIEKLDAAGIAWEPVTNTTDIDVSWSREVIDLLEAEELVSYQVFPSSIDGTSWVRIFFQNFAGMIR